MSPLMRGYMLGIIFPPMAGRCLGRANTKIPLGLKFSFPGVFTFARYPLMNPALTRSTAYADGSFVNGPRKTNVCFAAACFAMHIENAPVTHSKISFGLITSSYQP